MRILLLEDDQELSQWILKGLNDNGYVVDLFDNGRHALSAGLAHTYDIIILDRMTPELDGLSVLKALRTAKIVTPTLLLTALGDVDNRVEGLNAGADDYLGKPFAFAELLARVNALGRRQQGNTSTHEETVLSAGDLHLDLVKRRCTKRGENIELNTKEFKLMEIFMRNQGRVLTRSMLLDRVWSLNFNPTTSIVETHISRLRGKIDKPFGTETIKTLRNAGYVFEN